MDNGIKPSTIMLIAGGGVLLISSFLDWFSVASFGTNGWEVDAFGLHGIMVALIGVIVGLGAALTAFGGVSLPDSMLGFSRNQIFLILSFAAFLITFGQQFANGSAFGVTLGWIAAAVMTAGACMDEQGSRSAAPPTQF